MINESTGRWIVANIALLVGLSIMHAANENGPAVWASLSAILGWASALHHFDMRVAAEAEA
jgi:hypothetical protein